MFKSLSSFALMCSIGSILIVLDTMLNLSPLLQAFLLLVGLIISLVTLGALIKLLLGKNNICPPFVHFLGIKKTDYEIFIISSKESILHFFYD